MKIAYLISARYPTEKAYGVTIGNSLQSLKNMNHQVEIYSWGKARKDMFENSIYSVSKFKNQILLNKYNSKYIAKLAFLLNQFLFGLSFVFNFKIVKDFDFYWTREPLALLPTILLRERLNILIEIHHKITLSERLSIRLLSLKHHLKIIVLTERSKKYHKKIFESIPIEIVPMGVPNNFFNNKRRHIKSNCNKFIYIGKGFSNNNDNELNQIIKAAALFRNMDINFTFIGLEEDYKSQMIKMAQHCDLNENQVTFINHVRHSDIPNYLYEFDFGMLPYLENTYNEERFPLKMLEYLATGLPIIASSTKSHRSLLSEEFTIFYDSEDPKGLFEALNSAMKLGFDYASMSIKAIEYAKLFTYDIRVDSILNFVAKK